MTSKITILLFLFLPIAVLAKTVDLSSLTDDYVAVDGDTLTGRIEASYVFTIQDGAGITLSNAYIRGVGVICAGNATINLTGRNYIIANDFKAGIQIGGPGTTLYFKGNGTLYSYGGKGAAAIGLSAGNDNEVNGGDIVFESPYIIAYGGSGAAGIGTGSGNKALSMGSISIKGGTVETYGGRSADKSSFCNGIGEGCTPASVGQIFVHYGIKNINIEPGINAPPITYMHNENVLTNNLDDYFFIEQLAYDAVGIQSICRINKEQNIAHGSIGANNWETADDTIKINITPDFCYKLETLSIKDISGNEVDIITDNFSLPAGEGIIEFVMPAGGVTIEASFGLHPWTLTGTISEIQTIPDGGKIILSNAYINKGIVCNGSASITLEGSNIVSSINKKAGIQVGGTGTTLTINGDGSLVATGADGAAGIGLSAAENNDIVGGDIVIESGNITAMGSNEGAGIGTGATSTANISIGSITIKGGTVIAVGGTESNGNQNSGIGSKYTSATVGSVIIYTDIEKIDASSISNKTVYMRGADDVTKDKSKYFLITEKEKQRIIEPRYYSITVSNDLENGSVETETVSAKPDETISLTATPDFGYNFEAFAVNDAASNVIKVTDNKFTMPASDVTIYATFASKYPTLTFHDNGNSVEINGQYNEHDTLEIIEPIPVKSVIYRRNFTTDGYSTITLPFDVYTDNLIGVDSVLSFAGIVHDKNGKKAVGMQVVWEHSKVHTELKANTPYMLKMHNNTLGIDGEVTLVPTQSAVTAVDSWEFRGTYAYTVWHEDNEDRCKVYGFAGGSNDDVSIGEFVKFSEGAFIRPLRAYLINTKVNCNSKMNRPNGYARPIMASTDDELPDRMDVVIIDNDENGDEHTTVIGQFNARTGEFKMQHNYDLKGRNTQGKAKAKGMYYGKKVLNK